MFDVNDWNHPNSVPSCILTGDEALMEAFVSNRAVFVSVRSQVVVVEVGSDSVISSESAVTLTPGALTITISPM